MKRRWIDIVDLVINVTIVAGSIAVVLYAAWVWCRGE
jgi:hypothetical protein